MRLKLAICTLIIAVVSGCGTPGKEERAKAFDSSINKLKEFGFSVKQTFKDDNKISYSVNITDKAKASTYLLSSINMQTLSKKVKNSIASSIEKIGVDIDLNKLVKNSEDSVYVYLLDNNQSKSKVLSKLFKDKKIGAYITYNKDDQIKKIKSKELDFIDKSTHVILSSLVVDFKKPLNGGEIKDYTVTLKNIKLDDTNNKYVSGVFNFNNLKCDVTKDNLIVGKYSCKLENIDFNATSKLKKSDTMFKLKNISIYGESKSVDKKVVSSGNIVIDSAELKNNGFKSVDISLKNYKSDFSGFGMDKGSLESVKTLFKKGIEKPDVFKEYVKVIAKIYANNDIKGNSSFDEFKIDSSIGQSQVVTFLIKDYKADYSSNFRDVIDYVSHTKYSLLKFFGSSKTKPVDISINKYSDTFEIKKLYNFMPQFMEGLKIDPNYKDSNYIKEQELMYKKIALKTVNSGATISLSPVNIGSLNAVVGKDKLDFSKLDLGFSAKLKSNKLEFSNPMLKLLLMKNSDINAHIVLSKDDFKSLSTLLPPASVMIVGAFVKYENNNAVFRVKSKDGHLYLNGKPLM